LYFSCIGGNKLTDATTNVTGACLFCDVYVNEKWRVIRDGAYFYSVFDGFPISPGHALVIPKRHVVSLTDLAEDEWHALQPAITETLKIIEAADFEKIYVMIRDKNLAPKSPEFCENMLNHFALHKKPDAYNIGNNEGVAAGRTVHHLHMQIIPRYVGDVEDPRGGIRHVLPNLGNYKK
jgi:diadenosine tetraphosphate (Ap4A) HIT family hydrolase